MGIVELVLNLVRFISKIKFIMFLCYCFLIIMEVVGFMFIIFYRFKVFEIMLMMIIKIFYVFFCNVRIWERINDKRWNYKMILLSFFWCRNLKVRFIYVKLLNEIINKERGKMR